jgi:hypothetical protein
VDGGVDGGVEERARRQERAGDAAGAMRTLVDGLIHLNAHDDGRLPCLCRDCIVPDEREAEAGGRLYRRSWTVAKGRVLFFWIPEDLDDKLPRVRNAVRASLHGRLKGKGQQ